MSSRIQSIIFDKRIYTLPTAQHWLYRHKFVPIKLDETKIIIDLDYVNHHRCIDIEHIQLPGVSNLY